IRGLPRIVSVQNPYNLLNRTYENGLSEFADLDGVGLLAYSPLAMGELTGKYLNGARPEGARLTLFTRFQRYANPQAQQAVAEYVQLARDHGLSPAIMAQAFVNQQPFVISNLIGATRMDQLKENIDSVDYELTPELLKAIDADHLKSPNPGPRRAVSSRSACSRVGRFEQDNGQEPEFLAIVTCAVGGSEVHAGAGGRSRRRRLEKFPHAGL